MTLSSLRPPGPLVAYLAEATPEDLPGARRLAAPQALDPLQQPVGSGGIGGHDPLELQRRQAVVARGPHDRDPCGPPRHALEREDPARVRPPAQAFGRDQKLHPVELGIRRIEAAPDRAGLRRACKPCRRLPGSSFDERRRPPRHCRIA